MVIKMTTVSWVTATTVTRKCQPSKKTFMIDLSQPGPSHEHPDQTVSSTSKTHVVNLMHLKDMFPDLSLDVLSNCLSDKGSLPKAALSLSGNITDDVTSDNDSDLGTTK